mmetsp:Transcript_42249/g.100314  ORF Transcript_42249/g.100314 Transcript_42249/m.100314 type:complete len:207 (+) Transcript_42249:199-819(+)
MSSSRVVDGAVSSSPPQLPVTLLLVAARPPAALFAALFAANKASPARAFTDSSRGSFCSGALTRRATRSLREPSSTGVALARVGVDKDARDPAGIGVCTSPGPLYISWTWSLYGVKKSTGSVSESSFEPLCVAAAHALTSFSWTSSCRPGSSQRKTNRLRFLGSGTVTTDRSPAGRGLRSAEWKCVRYLHTQSGTSHEGGRGRPFM